jgi:hypothetical protein
VGDSAQNYAIEVHQGVLVVRMVRRTELSSLVLAEQARCLRTDIRDTMASAEVRAVLLDLRRARGAVGPAREDAFVATATLCETSSRRLAFLVSDAIQAIQTRRIVSESAPRCGAVFTSADEACAHVGLAEIADEEGGLDSPPSSS